MPIYEARQSGRAAGGGSLTAVETAEASWHRHEMDLALWEHGTRGEGRLAPEPVLAGGRCGVFEWLRSDNAFVEALYWTPRHF